MLAITRPQALQSVVGGRVQGDQTHQASEEGSKDVHGLNLECSTSEGLQILQNV